MSFDKTVGLLTALATLSHDCLFALSGLPACYVGSAVNVPDDSAGTCACDRCHAVSLIRPEIVDYVAFGTSRAQAVDENVALCGKTVPVALWKEAQASGIMNPLLPLPGDDAEPAAKKAKN